MSSNLHSCEWSQTYCDAHSCTGLQAYMLKTLHQERPVRGVCFLRTLSAFHASIFPFSRAFLQCTARNLQTKYICVQYARDGTECL
jgi:hypothetical protein